jgi:hypothetical protein
MNIDDDPDSADDEDDPARTGVASELEDARETYAQNELDHDRLPTEEGFWASSFAPTSGVDTAAPPADAAGDDDGNDDSDGM